MSDADHQSIDEIRQQVKRETLESVAIQLFDLLPVCTIARVCDLTVEEVLDLARRSRSDGRVAGAKSQKKQSHAIRLLDQPINNTTIPMALSTQHAIQRHKKAINKLKKYLRDTEE